MTHSNRPGVLGRDRAVAMRTDHESGATYADLATKYGVSKYTVWRVVADRIYKATPRARLVLALPAGLAHAVLARAAETGREPEEEATEALLRGLVAAADEGKHAAR